MILQGKTLVLFTVAFGKVVNFFLVGQVKTCKGFPRQHQLGSSENE